MELVNRLIKRFGYNEPITLEEVLSTWNEYSKPRVYQLLRNYANEGQLCKYEKGIYYVATNTILGKPSCLGFRQVVEKKYIQSGKEVFGYYGGLTLLNGLGFTTQMPNTLEIVTNKETTRVREVNLRGARLILRSARTKVTKDNVGALMLLEAFNAAKEPVDDEILTRIKEFAKETGVRRKDIFAYASVFPGKAIKNIVSSGVENVFA